MPTSLPIKLDELHQVSRGLGPHIYEPSRQGLWGRSTRSVLVVAVNDPTGEMMTCSSIQGISGQASPEHGGKRVPWAILATTSSVYGD